MDVERAGQSDRFAYGPVGRPVGRRQEARLELWTRDRTGRAPLVPSCSLKWTRGVARRRAAAGRPPGRPAAFINKKAARLPSDSAGSRAQLVVLSEIDEKNKKVRPAELHCGPRSRPFVSSGHCVGRRRPLIYIQLSSRMGAGRGAAGSRASARKEFGKAARRAGGKAARRESGKAGKRAQGPRPKAQGSRPAEWPRSRAAGAQIEFRATGPLARALMTGRGVFRTSWHARPAGRKTIWPRRARGLPLSRQDHHQEIARAGLRARPPAQSSPEHFRRPNGKYDFERRQVGDTLARAPTFRRKRAQEGGPGR